MVGESLEGLPEELRHWVDEQADTAGKEPGEILARAVALYRLMADDSGDGEETPIDDLESAVERLSDSVSDLDGRVETVEDDLETKITDVRERVIQVKREADAKAPADHDHEDIRAQLDRLETRVDRGFENYEEILTYLTDQTDELNDETDELNNETDELNNETDELNDKLTRLAQLVVSVRRRTARVERDVSRLDAAADLKATANREGLTKAKCGSCGNSVALGLLTEPACPHCESGFVDVNSPRMFFGSGTLVTGRPPALTAGDNSDGSGLEVPREPDDAHASKGEGPTDIPSDIPGEQRNG